MLDHRASSLHRAGDRRRESLQHEEVENASYIPNHFLG
jgi:hypothetical protein